MLKTIRTQFKKKLLLEIETKKLEKLIDCFSEKNIQQYSDRRTINHQIQQHFEPSIQNLAILIYSKNFDFGQSRWFVNLIQIKFLL